MVDRVIWDHEATGSNPVTPTRWIVFYPIIKKKLGRMRLLLWKPPLVVAHYKSNVQFNKGIFYEPLVTKA